MEKKATAVGNIALPVSYVQLTDLKTTAGEPVTVRVEAVDQLTMARIAALPGHRPEATEAAGLSPETIETMEKMAALSKPLIELSTSLVDAEGNDVRPAFWFDPNKPRHELSIPGRLLGVRDMADLCMEILRVSGYVGGASDEAKFPDADREGEADSPRN